MRIRINYLALLSFFLFPFAARAEDVVTLPADQLFARVVDLISAWGGMPWLGKVSGILLLIVASMQVSFIRPLWDKLGQAKAYVAPALALIAGVVDMLSNGSFSLPVLLAWLSAGAGAVILRQLLNVLKAIPGLSDLWKSIFDVIASALGGKPTVQLQEEKVQKIEAKIQTGKP